MKHRALSLILVCVLSGFLVPAGAQTFEETMSKLSMDAAVGYVNPIVNGFGVDMNGGWFHRAPKASMFGFDLEFGAVAMGTFFTNENKTFSNSGSFAFTQAQAMDLTNFVNTDPNIQQSQRAAVQNYLVQQITQSKFTLTVSGPTIIGSKSDSVKIHFDSKSYIVPGQGSTVVVPGKDVALPVVGFLGELPALPLAAPQLTFGTLVGTQLTFRYLPPSQNIKNMGKASYFGWGLQHNPGLWLGPADMLPVDVSLSFFTQKIKVGSIFESKATTYGINVSKQLGLGFLNLTPYAGFMLEKSTMSFSYDANLPDITNSGAVTVQHIAFDLESANKSRVVLGLSLRLLFINLNADYNIGKYNSYTAGVMICI